MFYITDACTYGASCKKEHDPELKKIFLKQQAVPQQAKPVTQPLPKVMPVPKPA